MVSRKKLQAFANQTKNIYLNRIGDYIVKVRFQENGATIDEKMAERSEERRVGKECL